MNFKIQIPDKLYNQAINFANNNDYNIDEFINFQFISYLENYLLNQLNEKSKNISREAFKRVLAKVPDVEPAEYDRL